MVDSRVQDPHILLLLIQYTIPAQFTTIPHLGGMLPDINQIPVMQGGGEDLAEVLRRLKVCVCNMGRV